MFEQNVAAESLALGEALLTGAAMGIYYDVFRIIRRIIRCRYANIVAQDLFFWATSAVAVFFVCIRLNDGIVRIIFIIGVLSGWLFYMLTAGAIVMLVTDTLTGALRKVFTGLHNKLINPALLKLKNRMADRKKKKTEEIDNKM